MNAIQRLGPMATLVALLLTSAAGAQTILVDTSNDVTDFGGARQVADLPGPDGKVSLAEAGLASDNTPGIQTIGFHIPQSDWQMQWLYPGRAVLQPFLGFRIFQPAILDATTQTAFTGETNPEGGGEVVIWAQVYLVDNVGSVMRGFDHTSISVSGGSANVVEGNTQANIEVYDSPFTRVGGTSPGQGNTCGTIKIDRSSNDVVIGNTTTRVRVLGGGPPALDNRIGGPSAAERNFITGYGTWSEGCPGGTTVQIFEASGTIVENNWIGTTPDGLAQGSLASTTGIGLEGECHDTIIRDNRIAGILGHGTGPHCVGWLVGTAIQVYGTGSGVSIVGNTIGLNANNEPVLGSVTGIATVNYYLGPVQDVVIGGTAPGDGNEIAGQLLAGVSVANTYSGVHITGNSIHDNGGLGIDLITNGFVTGVTPNDALDVDVGGNELQNFPVLQSATGSGSTVRVTGTLSSSASSSFTLEFFAAPECDASGFGEGQDYLGSTSVSTDVSGNAAFDVTLAASVAQGWFVSATATSAVGASTSEFCACVVVTTVPPPAVVAFCFGDGSLPTACPCAPPNTVPAPPAAPGHGCANSFDLNGALLSASGLLSPDTLAIRVDVASTYAGFAFVVKGDAVVNSGVATGDGVLCASGTLVRFGSHFAGTNGNPAGQWIYPNTAQTTSISAATLQPAAQTAYYQLYYRNAAANFCNSSTANFSNGIRVAWP